MNKRSFIAQRPLACLAAAYGLGILPGFLMGSFDWRLPLAGFILSLIAVVSLWERQPHRLLALCAAFLLLGSLRGGPAAHPALPPEGSYRVEGTVQGESAPSEDGQRAKALLRDVLLMDGQGKQAGLPVVYWTYYLESDQPLPLDGQRASFTGRLYHPRGQSNPYGFDFRQYLLERGIPAGISGARELALTPGNQPAPASVWLRIRQSLSQRLDRVFPGHSPLAKALLLGVRSDLDESLSQSFRDAGIAHVLAVSGLHVGFLVLGLMKLLRGLRLSPKALLAVFFVLLLFYCRLLDFTPSVVRASILSLILLLGKALKRRIDPLTSLAAAFLLILLFRPLDLFNLGFQLSFLAVLGIITLGDRFNSLLLKQGWFLKLPGLARKTIQAYAITLSASLATFIPLINAFHAISLIGLLISPPAIALIGILMAGFVLGLLVSFLSLPLARLSTLPFSLLAGAYEASVAFLAGLPYAHVRLKAVSFARWLPAYAGLWLMTRYSSLRRAPRLAAIGVLSLAFLALPLAERDSGLKYIQLDMGFSDSALILDGDATFVIDAGSHGGDLAGFLASRSREIDALILTHLHGDHVGGLRQLLDSGLEIHEILLPHSAMAAGDSGPNAGLLEEARQAGIPLRELGRGDMIVSGRARGEVLWPVRDALYPGLGANEGSLVIYWDLDGVSLLATGDQGAAYAPYALRQADIMKLPHHGAKRDNTQDRIARVNPGLALITADGSRPQHYASAQELLDRMGVYSLVTGRTGAITLDIRDGALSVETHLNPEDD